MTVNAYMTNRILRDDIPSIPCTVERIIRSTIQLLAKIFDLVRCRLGSVMIPLTSLFT